MATIQEIKDSLYSSISTYTLEANPLANEQAIKIINNYALMMSSVIGDAIDAGGGGGSGGGAILSDYVKKSGGVDAIMAGQLTSNNGFMAGIGGANALSFEKNIALARDLANFPASINMQSDLFYGYKKVLSVNGTIVEFNKDNEFTGGFDFGLSPIKTKGDFQVGLTPIDGFFTDGEVVKFKDNDIYHYGNSNLDTIDWRMKNGFVAGTLVVEGEITSKSLLSALYGFKAGVGGVIKLATRTEGIDVVGDIYMGVGTGIISNTNLKHIIKDSGSGNTSIDASGGNILIGQNNTVAVRLMTSLTDETGVRNLIDKFGLAKFNWGITGGVDGVSTFSAISRGTSNAEKGTIFYNFIDIANQKTRIKSNDNFDFEFITNDIKTSIGKNSNNSYFSTTATNFIFDKPLYSKNTIGVSESATRLENNKVFVGESTANIPHYFQNMPDGVKLFGKMYFTDDITTETFSTGFSGSGVSIKFSDSSITADEITVRKKIRSYETEVQNNSAINGSIWISSSCSGDSVEEIV